MNHGTSKLDMYIFIVPHFSTTGNPNKTLLTKAYAKVAMCWCHSAISVAKSWHALTEGIIAISLRDSDPTHVVGFFFGSVERSPVGRLGYCDITIGTSQNLTNIVASTVQSLTCTRSIRFRHILRRSTQSEIVVSSTSAILQPCRAHLERLRDILAKLWLAE